MIDRDAGTVTVHCEPSPAGYRAIHWVPFGGTITIPDPVSITLETGELKDYVR